MRPTTLTAALTAAVAALTLSGCGSAQDGFNAATQPPATVTVQATPSPSVALPSSPTAQPVTQVTIPDVDGKNGAIALEALREAGLTNVQPASRDEQDKLVINPANWTVTSVEPGAGEEVASDSTVVVTMTKK